MLKIKQHQKSISLLIFHKPCFFSLLLSGAGSDSIFVRSHLTRYDAKRQEIEAWLNRMESRSERMGNTAAAPGDTNLDFSVLDAQQKEQKVCDRNLYLQIHQFYKLLDKNFLMSCGPFEIHVLCCRLWNINDLWWILDLILFQTFHAELHTYKVSNIKLFLKKLGPNYSFYSIQHHIELFNQLTQKLIAVYPADDVSRIKRITESINLRYVFFQLLTSFIATFPAFRFCWAFSFLFFCLVFSKGGRFLWNCWRGNLTYEIYFCSYETQKGIMTLTGKQINKIKFSSRYYAIKDFKISNAFRTRKYGVNWTYYNSFLKF